MQILIYTNNIRRVSGKHTWEMAFIQAMKPYHNIKLVYRTANVTKLKELEGIVECIEYNGQKINCDICIYSSTRGKRPKIIAKKYIQVIHANLKVWDPTYNQEGVDIHVAVSKTVQEEVKKDFNIKSVVIPNLITTTEIGRMKRFITCSRIAKGKGMERMVKMAKEMKEQGRRFTWEVYGGGSGQPRAYLHKLQERLKDIPEVIFLGPRDKIQTYIAECDYLVQLSDNEGFCYSVYEALSIGVPCIVTRWDGVEDIVKNGENGYIVNMDMSDLDLDKIFRDVPQAITFNYLEHNKESIDKWRKLLNQ